MAFCINCGQQVDGGTRICRHCGTDTQTGQRGAGPQEYVPPRPYAWASDSLTGRPAPPQPVRQQPPQFQPTQFQPQQYAPPPAPVPYANQGIQSGYGYNYRCPNCGTNAHPRIEEKISQGGWIVFAILLVVFFPLFWVGLLMKEKYQVCPVCRVQFA
jgi:RNA polymerase subunit RPABC4/transcription elongation factor Spt4